MALALCLAGCARSGYVSTVRLQSVSAESEVLYPGQAGLRVLVTLVNDTTRDVALHRCQLNHRAEREGAGFSAVAIAMPALIPADTTALLRFSVRLPAGAGGRAVLDARAELLDAGIGKSWELEGAEQPLVFSYGEGDSPDLSHLPALVVTTADDELDGGAGVASVEAAGGADDLSLREALSIVANQGVAHRVAFDETVFAAPQARPIVLGALDALPDLSVAGTAVDALGAQVRIEQDAANPACGIFSVSAPDVVLRGLDLVGYSDNCVELSARLADRLLVSDCRLSAFGDSSAYLSLRESPGATLRRLRVTINGKSASVEDCDGLLVEQCELSRGLHIVDSAGVVVRQSQLTSRALSLSNSPDAYLGGNVLTGYEDVAWSGSAIVVADLSHRALVEDSWIQGPCEHSGGGYAAMVVDAAQQVTLRHNLVLDAAAEPIALFDGANADLDPPVVTQATTSAVRGQASAPDGSTVEIFADVNGDLARWVADAELRGNAFSAEGLDLDPGEQVRATLTDPAGNTSPASAPVTVP